MKIEFSVVLGFVVAVSFFPTKFPDLKMQKSAKENSIVSRKIASLPEKSTPAITQITPPKRVTASEVNLQSPAIEAVERLTNAAIERGEITESMRAEYRDGLMTEAEILRDEQSAEIGSEQ